MLWLIAKTIFLYFIVIIIIRSFGKSTFAQLTVHDLASIFLVITIATGPLVTDQFGDTLIALFVVFLIHTGLAKLMLVNRLKTLFIGKPAIVIKHGKLIRDNLRYFHLTLSELLAELREKGYPDITLIDYAIIEPYGGISIVPKEEARPVTPDQLNLESTYRGLPITVIVEGRIQEHNLRLLNRDQQWLKQELDKSGFRDINDVFYAAVREQDKSLLVDGGAGASSDDRDKSD